jgi:hypothetical protein
MRVKAVYVSSQSVDFRKSHDGLLAECYRLGTDPFAGDMVVFIGRNRRRIKILFADATGLWLASKRFTDYAMKTSFKFLSDKKRCRQAQLVRSHNQPRLCARPHWMT